MRNFLFYSASARCAPPHCDRRSTYRISCELPLRRQPPVYRSACTAPDLASDCQSTILPVQRTSTVSLVAAAATLRCSCLKCSSCGRARHRGLLPPNSTSPLRTPVTRITHMSKTHANENMHSTRGPPRSRPAPTPLVAAPPLPFLPPEPCPRCSPPGIHLNHPQPSILAPHVHAPPCTCTNHQHHHTQPSFHHKHTSNTPTSTLSPHAPPLTPFAPRGSPPRG